MGAQNLTESQSQTFALLSASQLEANPRLAKEPIAMIGIGCRLPGAKGPNAFWHLLREEVDAITKVPDERFDIDAVYDPRPGISGKLYTRWGGCLEQVDQFDPYMVSLPMILVNK